MTRYPRVGPQPGTSCAIRFNMRLSPAPKIEPTRADAGNRARSPAAPLLRRAGSINGIERYEGGFHDEEILTAYCAYSNLGGSENETLLDYNPSDLCGVCPPAWNR